MADRPAPEVYRLSMEKLPLAVARARRVASLKVAVAATIVVALLTPFTASPSSAVDVALVVALLAFLVLPYVLWRVGTRARRHWNAFELAIGADSIRLAAKGAGRVIVRRDEITRIVEGGTGLTVHSAEPGVSVYVPRWVEGYLDARARLAAVRPISRRADEVRWAAACVAAGGALVATAFLWAREPAIGGGLVVCQAAFAVFAAFEIVGHPALSGGARAATLAAIAAAGLAPALGLLHL
jgi:hypothetical protein